MNYVFEIIDKTGRKIHLTKERWTHITSPASPHAYMANFIEEIKQTIIEPEFVRIDSIENKKMKYYKYFKERKKYLRAIVKYLNGNGFIITAYFISVLR